MTSTGTFRVSFHVSHPTLSAKEVMASFMLKPRYSRSAGAERVTPRGTQLGGVYSQTDVGFAVSEVVDNDHVQVAQIIESAMNDLPLDTIGRIVESGGSCFFLIGLYSEGNLLCDFPAKLLSLLAASCIGLKLDFYGGADQRDSPHDARSE